MRCDERFPHGRRAQFGVDLGHASFALRARLSLRNVSVVCWLWP